MGCISGTFVEAKVTCVRGEGGGKVVQRFKWGPKHKSFMLFLVLPLNFKGGGAKAVNVLFWGLPSSNTI